MKYTVLLQGNSGKDFPSIDEALRFARLEIYATQATIIRAFDDLKEGKVAQWCYGFRSVAIFPETI